MISWAAVALRSNMDAAEYKHVRREILFIDARKLGAMTALADLTLFPGWRLEQLQGGQNRPVQHSHQRPVPDLLPMEPGSTS
ncbi:hypothetical protein [Candidatus Amarolinea dominans]|uniref:hypothetical protein n=1 Tax=Candidatus Amarolinea dominans TaxID=3140696 RepID=UPI0031CC6911